MEGVFMNKKMIIVGAGIAGLSAGFYARLNGFSTTIYESHNAVGGLCAAWKRKGYTFDISMHLVTNSKTGPFRKMWQELGVVGDREFLYHDELTSIEGLTGNLRFSIDPKKLLDALTSLSPEDAGLCGEFVELFCGPGIMGAASLKPAEFCNVFDYIKMVFAILPLMKMFRKHGNTTIQDFAARFRDPFLRQAIRFSIDSPGWPMHRFPMTGLAGFASSAVSDSGTPRGGSNNAVRDIAERYKNLEGELRLGTKVVDVIIENDTAVGVRLDDGSEEKADFVVWAGDGHHLIFDILRGRYTNDAIRKMYTEWTPVQPMVHVMLGINRDMSREPHRLLKELDTPVEIAGETHSWISIINHSIDPTTAPSGKTALEVWYATRYDYWKTLAADRDRYEAEKKRIADFSITALDKRWPGIRSQIEVTDVATPATYVRYTGNWQGSPDGWYVTPENMMERSMQRSLPGLKGLYTVGQWTAPFTGTVMAALSGRQLVEILCRKAHKRFVTTLT
jgi:phytoene dehydrogenase-like protein